MQSKYDAMDVLCWVLATAAVASQLWLWWAVLMLIASRLGV